MSRTAEGRDEWVPFVYRDYHDLPRAIVFHARGRRFFLECEFDAEADEYRDSYVLMELPLELELHARDWRGLEEEHHAILGHLPVSELVLDESGRRWLNAGVGRLAVLLDRLEPGTVDDDEGISEVREVQGFRLRVTGGDSVYLGVPNRETHSDRTVFLTPPDEHYRGPDVIADLDAQGELLGLELLFDSPPTRD